MKEVLSILLGIGLLSLILIPGLVNKKNEEPSTNVDLEEKESITPAPVTNIKPDYELFMCLGVNNGMPVDPRTDFSTIDKIHCLIRWQGITPGDHKVEFYWINPTEETQEYYKQDIVVVTGGRHNSWAWLRLREGEFIISTEFAGRWSVQVFFDGEFITEESFRVN